MSVIGQGAEACLARARGRESVLQQRDITRLELEMPPLKKLTNE